MAIAMGVPVEFSGPTNVTPFLSKFLTLAPSLLSPSPPIFKVLDKPPQKRIVENGFTNLRVKKSCSPMIFGAATTLIKNPLVNNT